MKIHGGGAPEGVIDLSSNLNSFFPEEVIEKILSKIDVKFFTRHPSIYPDALEEKIASYEGLGRENVCVLPGSVDGIYRVFNVVRPEYCVIPVPTFNEYAIAAEVNGVAIRYVRLDYEKGFKLCLNDIVCEMDEKSMVFVCNPNNPTGFLFGVEEAKALIRRAQYVEAFVVFDEAFVQFSSWEDRYNFVVATDNAVVFRSFTKFFSIPGIRLGYAIGSKNVISKLKQLLPSWAISKLAEFIGIELLNMELDYSGFLEKINREKEFLYNALSELGFHPYRSYANFIFVKVPEGLKASWIRERLLEKGIAIRDFPEYTDLLKDMFFRVSVGKSEHNRLFIKKLKEVLDEGM